MSDRLILAFSEPPAALCMRLAKSGKAWFRRVSQAEAPVLREALIAAGIKGIDKKAGAPQTQYNPRVDGTGEFGGKLNGRPSTGWRRKTRYK